MITTAELADKIEGHCRERGISPSTFGRKVVNDGKLIGRLRAGKSIRLDTLQRIEEALVAPSSDRPGEAQ
jgi:hypothetical protein